MKKLSHEHIFNLYLTENYILKSIYNGCMKKDTLICPIGHEIEMSFNNFKVGSRCFKCFGSEKLTQEYVETYYKNEGYILKTIYKNCMNKDVLICPNGHIIKMSFGRFKLGNRCKKCFINKITLSQKEVVDYYFEENYIMKSIYINAFIKNKLICPNGHRIEINFNNFQQGKRCKQCYYENNIGENHPNWIDDRTRKRRLKYLSFDLYNLNLLNDDPNYNDYLINKEKYHIDHIQPRVAFIDNNLDNIHGNIVIKNICNLRENLRIILKESNGSKGGKYNPEEFMKWFNSKL